LVQAQPSRLKLLAGKVVALVAFTLAGTLTATLAAVGSAYLVAPMLDVSTSAWGDGTIVTLLQAFGQLSLSTVVWGLIGLTVATLTRSAGVSIAVGIGWVVVFETMLQGVAEGLADKMPGAMLTALAAGGTSTIGFGTAVVLAAIYTAVALLIAVLVTRRREITY
jgi:ABC-type transport system involved in multi-copper enzyme maturation permease subunit